MALQNRPCHAFTVIFNRDFLIVSLVASLESGSLQIQTDDVEKPVFMLFLNLQLLKSRWSVVEVTEHKLYQNKIKMTNCRVYQARPIPVQNARAVVEVSLKKTPIHCSHSIHYNWPLVQRVLIKYTFHLTCSYRRANPVVVTEKPQSGLLIF